MTPSILVTTPAHACDPSLAIAAVRAGETGLLDLGLDVADAQRATALAHLARIADGRPTWGVRWETLGSRMPEWLGGLVQTRFPWLLIAGLDGDDPPRLAAAIEQGQALADRVLVEVYDSASAVTAAKLPCHGLVVKALEAGGRVGGSSSFLLLQELHGRFDRPWWIQGAWGPDTAAAAYLAGAAGIVLGEELWLTRESSLPEEERRRLAALDGSETVLLGDRRVRFRLFGQVDREGLGALAREVEAGGEWQAALHERWLARGGDGASPCRGPRPLGQGIAFASRLAGRHVTTGGTLQAFRETVAGHLRALARQRSLAAEAPLARDLGTRYPVLQGPMTRVSDVPGFCDCVAQNGALPFLALALMRGDETRALLEETRRILGKKPWGVGVLGFVPPELRREQIEAIAAARPGFAIIAGGRPAQASALDAAGVSTYLHVPSPGLLASFLEQGARKLVFEGRECGGHVGPRTSFTLWQSAIDVLLDAEIDDPESVHVIFAGGIHDALSSALVQALAVPLVERGMKIGVLMGTAYLFTCEAVSCGAITPEFQAQALACRETTLLQSGVGHATRCARTAFAAEFDRRRRELILAGRAEEEILFELEMLNVGRLRIASKGVARVESGEDPPPSEDLLARGARMLQGRLAPVDVEAQRRAGLYMIGEVATLRDRTTSMAELHEEVCARGTAQATRLAARELSWQEGPQPPRAPHEPIAIVGMACRFPRSPDLRAYWNNILAGFDAVREVPHERWSPERFYSEDRRAPDRLCSKWGSFLDPSRFDPLEYGIPPASLASIEPIQLLALEVAARAMDDAGYGSRLFRRDRTAVIFGAGGGVNDLGMGYVIRTVMPHYLDQVEGLDETTKQRVVAGLRGILPEWTEDSFPGFLMNVLSGRVANRLDLQGSNFVVDAACAASLAALQTAMDQLRAGTCDMALVGGADATNNAFMFMSFAKTHALTPTGRIRPFDERADGIVLGEGIAAIVLKRLADAERDGDRIHALIRGIGSSSDGRNRSLTAPHAPAQTLAITRALSDAAVLPESVTLIEAHATGTAVGDRSEIAAMTAVFGTVDRPEPYCAVGSVKSMIGHTKTVAGLAGLIKTALALEHRVLPPTINVELPNRQADFDHSPFYVNSETRPWIRRDADQPRRAGVSAFGFGGTNFHAVLEEYTGNYPAGGAHDLGSRAAEIFLWSRADRGALARDVERLLDALGTEGDFDLGRLAYGSHLGERAQPAHGGGVRAGIAATSIEDLRVKLKRLLERTREPRGTHDELGLHLAEGPAAKGETICFLFPGQGAQYPGMLADLVRGVPGGLESFEQADRLLADLLPRPLSSYIYPRPVFDKAARKRLAAELADTRIAQPAIGLVSVFACDLLTRFGLRPAFAAGHSYGEHVALSAMGLLSRDDLLRSSAIRGRAVHEAERDHPGCMAAVAASADETRQALDALGIPATIANVNAPRQVVIAGPVDVIGEALARLPGRGLAVRRLAVSAAFHTAAMEQPSASFGEHLQQLEMRAPRLPVYSNVTAEPYPSEIEAIRRQMSAHLARPVRFVDQVRALHRDGARIFVEVGPGRILTGFVRRILEQHDHAALTLDAPGQPGWAPLAELLVHAHALGLPIEGNRWFDGRGYEATPAEAYLAAARRRAQGRPTDWIVDSRGARPSQASPRPVAIAGAVAAGKETGTPTMKKEVSSPPEPAAAAGERPTRGVVADPELLAQLNTALQGWLELQREQQRAGQRFLAIQERIVAGLFGGVAPALHGSAVENGAAFSTLSNPSADRDARAAADLLEPAGPVTALGVAPAPVVRDLRPIPALPEIDPDAAGPDARPLAASGPRAGEAAQPGVERFTADLLAEISRRTGYPEDMLELDAQLEAGLGIDSIKTMEILGALKQYHAVLSDEGEMDEESLIRLMQMRTLREIVDFYASRAEHKVLAAPAEAERAQPTPRASAIERLVLRPIPSPPHTASEFGEIGTFPRDQVLLLLGEAPELTSSIEAALTANGHRVARLTHAPEFRDLGGQRYAADLADLASVRRVADRIHGAQSAIVGGLVNLLGLCEPLNRPGLNGSEAPLRLVQWLTNVAQVFENDIRSSGPAGGGWLINVTSFDGRFGLRGSRELPLAQAGSLGFFKSLGREWRTRVKNVDLDPGADPRSLLVGLLQEIAAQDGPVEVGLDAEGRWQLELVGAEPSAAATGSLLPLDRASVLLATGGGDGITAEIVKRLAQETHCRVVVVGRTEVEPADATDGPEDGGTEQSLRAALIERMRSERGSVTAGEIEREVQRRLKRRRVRSNLAAFRAAGSEVEYHSIDVRDAAALGALIDSLYARHGRIDGVLHGAGVVEDCQLRDKTPESLARVFETKVKSAHTLARKLRADSLRFFALFSSVSGRFGNAGQSDYAAANEYLNKLAGHLDREWPGRVVAVNWGPWDAGMMPPALRTAMIERGVELIPADGGARALLDELRLEPAGEVEVVLTCTPRRVAGFEEPRA